MSRLVGTVVRGLRTPIFMQGDDVVEMTTKVLVDFLEAENVDIGEKDVLAITESVVARAQGNYATVDQVSADIKAKFGDSVIFTSTKVPIKLSSPSNSQFIFPSVLPQSMVCFSL